MIDRALEIARMMGYPSIDAVLEAIANGDLILVKLPEGMRQQVADWIHARVPEAASEDEVLAHALDDIADGIEFAWELERYPADADICEMNVPSGWPSYCDKSKR